MTSFLSFPELGKTFLETTNLRNTPPGSLSFHGPQDVEAAALEALGKSMAKSMGNHGFSTGFDPFCTYFILFLPPIWRDFLQILGRIQGISPELAQSLDLGSSGTKLQQQHYGDYSLPENTRSS